MKWLRRLLPYFAAGLVGLVAPDTAKAETIHPLPGQAQVSYGSSGYSSSEKYWAEDPNSSVHLIGGVGIGMQIEPICSVSGFPEKVRKVPAHPDDDWVNPRDVGTIRDAELNYPAIFFVIRGQAGLTFGRGEVRYGFGLNLNGLFSGTKNIEERNYTNAPGSEDRGEGAALTYYGFNGVKKVVPGLFLRVCGEEKGSAFFEYLVEFHSVSAENGWDRHDDTQTHKRFPLTNLTKHAIMTGAGYNSRVYLGFVIVNSSPSELGREVNLKTPNHIVVGTQVGLP